MCGCIAIKLLVCLNEFIISLAYMIYIHIYISLHDIYTYIYIYIHEWNAGVERRVNHNFDIWC